MKVGDLVQVLPARYGYYIVLEEEQPGYFQLTPIIGNTVGGLMHEQFIELVSECP
jgi:hypothetical protein